MAGWLSQLSGRAGADRVGAHPQCPALPGCGLPTVMGPRAQAPLSSALSDSYSSHGRMFSIDLIRTLVLRVAEL